MAGVRIEALRKVFPDGTVAVHGLDLDIADGEFLTLLGPSGCGKSTTLRMLAGLEPATSGRILFDGARVEHLAPGPRNIAMVFQNYALYPHMTVRGNLEYPLRKRGVARPERHARVAAAAAILQISELLDRKPAKLSGGQQQRVALGRAMIRDPAVFLLDEPLSNLDAQLRVALRGELVRIHKVIGRTMVFVTHDQLEAMTMSDRIAVMHRGRLQQVGTPAEIYGRPANRFVASFIGTPTMNFLAGIVSAQVFQAGRLRVTAPGTPDHGHAVAGLRPEAITVGQGDLTARVTLVEPTGHENLVRLDLDGVTLVARAPATMRLVVDAPVSIAINGAALQFFSPESGDRLPERERRDG